MHPRSWQAFVCLYVIDLTDPTAPTVIGRLVTPYVGWEIERTGNFLLLAAGNSGLPVIDVSVSTSPVEVGFVNTSGPALGVNLKGDLLTVAAGTAGLRLIDVSDPLAPVEIGSFASGDLSVVDVSVGFDTAYLMSSKGTPHIVDIHEPANPEELGFLARQPPGRVTFAVREDVVAFLTYPINHNSGSWLVDVRDPSKPSIVGYVGVMKPFAVEIIGTNAFVLTETDGLHVIDINTPSSPLEIARLALPEGFRPDWMEVHGNLVAIHNRAGTLLVDVIDPAGPKIVGVIDIGPFRVGQVVVSNNLLYITVDDVDLWAIDVSDPSVPLVVSEFENIAGGTLFNVDAGESVAYIQGVFTSGGACQRL